MAVIIHTTYDDLDNKTLRADEVGEISVQTDSSIGRTAEGALTVDTYLKVDADARFVNITGDTSTGNQYIKATTPTTDTGFHVAPSTGTTAYPQMGMFISQDKDMYFRIKKDASNYVDIVSWIRDSNTFASGIFPLAANVYTKSEADSRFLNTGEAYLKAETYSKTEADGRFVNTNETTVPVGGVQVMATGTHPVDRFPGTTWAILSDGRYIMGGNQGNPTSTGGATSQAITQAMLPNANFTLNAPVFRGREEDGGGGVGWENGSEYLYTNSGGSGNWIPNNPAYMQLVFWKRNS